MLFSRWTFLQVIIIALLVIAALIADRFRSDIAVPFSASNNLNKPMFMIYFFIVIVVGLFSLLMYFQAKKSDTFLKHRIWEKMHIIAPALLVMSFVVIFVLIDWLGNLGVNDRWMMYVVIYYVLFLLNLIVLAIIHKVKKNKMTTENKLWFSFVGTTVGFFVILFLL